MKADVNELSLKRQVQTKSCAVSYEFASNQLTAFTLKFQLREVNDRSR